MTDKEFLESLDTVPNIDSRTVTISLRWYNELLTSWAKLHTVIDFAKATHTYPDFKDEVEVILGLREEECKTDA